MKRTIVFDVDSDGELDTHLTLASRQKIRAALGLIAPNSRWRGATKQLSEILGCTRQRTSRILDTLGLREEFEAKIDPESLERGKHR